MGSVFGTVTKYFRGEISRVDPEDGRKSANLTASYAFPNRCLIVEKFGIYCCYRIDSVLLSRKLHSCDRPIIMYVLTVRSKIVT